MGEAAAITRWDQEEPLYRAWGNLLTSQIRDALKREIHEPLDSFLKVPAIPRVKTIDSLRAKVQRKLSKGESLDTIDDKVGVRFVVLLSEQIKIVEKAIETLEYPFTKDRDYEAERDERPLEFAYQSVHLVVKTPKTLELDGMTLPKNLACEVQIRTLLQHAHSELTHDRLYKARKLPPNSLNRSVARSMALIEATDDIFSDVARELEVAETELRELMNHLDALYEELLQSKPQLSRYSAGIVGDLLPCAIEEPKAKVVALFQDKGYLIENIRERLDEEAIYSTSAVLFAYLCLVESKDLTKAHWPLSGTVLDDLGADLGISFD